MAQPEQVYESDEGYEKPAESDQAESDQVYDQLAEAEPVSHTDAEQTGAGDSQGDVAAFSKGDVEGGDANDNFASMDSLEGEIESAYDGELTAENDRMPDEQDERRRVDGEAVFAGARAYCSEHGLGVDRTESVDDRQLAGRAHHSRTLASRIAFVISLPLGYLVSKTRRVATSYSASSIRFPHWPFSC